MNIELQTLMGGLKQTGDAARDVTAFLAHHGCPNTAAHSGGVAAEARHVAVQTGVNTEKAEAAGWLHDVSAIIPSAERIEVAKDWSVEILPEEAAFPMIVHQKLSVVIARAIFNIDDAAILSAVGCHTTLKADASSLDKVVFVADKLAWDQPGIALYRDAMLAALEHSLDTAALVYLQYLWDRRETLKVAHPWMEAAYKELAGT